jgi:spore germination protein YaaH
VTRARRLPVLLLAVALVAPAHAAEARDARPLEATGYALAGAARTADVTRDGRYLRTIGVDGVVLAGPRAVTPVTRDAHALRRAAQRHHRRAVLLVSNYTDALGDFDEPLAHRMLSSRSNRAAVVRSLVRRARAFDGVQVDLESLLPRDTAGLTAFTRELRRALPRRASLSMAVMASTDDAGYRARGYDLRRLARSLDRVVLMAYDQHGPTWSGPGAIGSVPWVRSELRFLVRRVPRRKVDLGVAAYGYQWGGGAATLTVPQARRLAGPRARWSGTHAEWHARLPGGRTIWWSDRRSLRAREKVARAAGVHGVAVWQIGSSGRLR